MNNHIKNIGKLEGEVLVFGGIYSNLQALEQLQKIAQEKQIPPQNIICTGDIVAYCAQPEECLQLVMDWGIHCIAGNVELQLANGEEDCGCNFDEASRCDLFSRQWYPFAQKNIRAESLDWIRQLPQYLSFEYANKKGFVLHGAYQQTSEFIFQSTDWIRKKQQFDTLRVDLILGGHCGIPFSDIQQQKYWLNAGVIGMPANDGKTDVWYLMLNESSQNLTFQFQSFAYDCETAAQLMETHQLPLQYAHTLRTGIWDNCDILPVEETNQQGKKLYFNSGSYYF